MAVTVANVTDFVNANKRCIYAKVTLDSAYNTGGEAITPGLFGLITIDDICYFQADNKYTAVVTATAQSLINKTIKELLDELDPDVFLQIHRGTVVNINAIAAVHRNLRGRVEVQLKERNETLQVSTSFAHLFKQM